MQDTGFYFSFVPGGTRHAGALNPALNCNAGAIFDCPSRDLDWNVALSHISRSPRLRAPALRVLLAITRQPIIL